MPTVTITIKWIDGTTDTYSSTTDPAYSADGQYATFTTTDGKVHKVRLSSTKEVVVG